jgi:hypothetical protein
MTARFDAAIANAITRRAEHLRRARLDDSSSAQRERALDRARRYDAAVGLLIAAYPMARAAS